MTTPKRPHWLIALFVGLMFVQCGIIVKWLSLFFDLNYSSLSPMSDMVVSGLWILIFAWTVTRLWRKPSTWHTSLITLWLFGAYSVWRLATFVRADYDRGRLPFVLIAFGIFTLIIGGIYTLRWLRLRRNTP